MSVPLSAESGSSSRCVQAVASRMHLVVSRLNRVSRADVKFQLKFQRRCCSMHMPLYCVLQTLVDYRCIAPAAGRVLPRALGIQLLQRQHSGDGQAVWRQIGQDYLHYDRSVLVHGVFAAMLSFLRGRMHPEMRRRPPDVIAELCSTIAMPARLALQHTICVCSTACTCKYPAGAATRHLVAPCGTTCKQLLTLVAFQSGRGGKLRAYAGKPLVDLSRSQPQNFVGACL